jgi:hypothetical protein
VHPLDKSANADGQRRRLDRLGHEGAPVGPRPDLSPIAPTTMAPLLRQLLAEHAATGLPPAYLPTPVPTPVLTTPCTNPPPKDRS